MSDTQQNPNKRLGADFKQSQSVEAITDLVLEYITDRVHGDFIEQIKEMKPEIAKIISNKQ